MAQAPTAKEVKELLKQSKEADEAKQKSQQEIGKDFIEFLQARKLTTCGDQLGEIGKRETKKFISIGHIQKSGGTNS